MRKKTVLFNLQNAGFTLIELIVVFSVIAIISTVGIAAFVNYSRSQSLNQAAIDFSTTINTARSRASSQVKPSIIQCNDPMVLDGYSVTLDLVANPNTYSLNVVCSGNIVVIKTTKLPAGITFNSNSTTSVFFSILTSAVKLNGTGDIILAGYGQTKTIKVKALGVIQ